MGEAVLITFGLAVGVMVAPTMAVGMILLLMTERAKANGVALALGWVTSLVIVIVVAWVGVSFLGVRGAGNSAKHDTIMLVAGGALILLSGYMVYRRARSSDGTSDEMPRWLRAVDAFTPRRSFLVGMAVGDVKNYILVVAAVTTVQAASRDFHPAVTLILFVLIGSAGVLLPLAVYLLRGERADATLKRWRDWLIAHNALIMSILLAVFGCGLIVRGVVG